jgi:protein gp37
MIEWCTESWNPTVGCSLVSPGCANCYAMKQAWRNFKFGTRGYENVVKATKQGARWTGNVNFVPSALAKPLKRRKPSIWFVDSMSDLFHEKVTNEQIAAVVGVIMATAARNQHFVVLTKRIERVPQWLKWLEDSYDDDRGMGIACLSKFDLVPGIPESVREPVMSRTGGTIEWPPKNWWIGPSIENQETCNERLPVACELGRKGFNVVLSLEPLLGPVTLDLSTWPSASSWVLLGGESDQGADGRPYDANNWGRPIIKHCAHVGIPLFHKQLGSNPLNVNLTNPGPRGDRVETWPEDLRVRQAPPALHAILEAAQRLSQPGAKAPGISESV